MRYYEYDTYAIPWNSLSQRKVLLLFMKQYFLLLPKICFDLTKINKSYVRPTKRSDCINTNKTVFPMLISVFKYLSIVEV